MSKFFNLIVNELVKILAKSSTKIMLAIIVLLAFFWNLAAFINDREMRKIDEEVIDYDYIFEVYKYSEEYESMYQFLKEIGVTVTSDWRYDAMQDITDELSGTLRDYPSQREAALEWYEKLKKPIGDNDPKGYLARRIEYINTLPGMDSDTKKAYAAILKFAMENDIPPTRHDSRFSNLLSLIDKKAELSLLESMPADIRDTKRITTLKNEIAISEYAIEKNITTYLTEVSDEFSPFYFQGFWFAFSESVNQITVISLLILIIAGSIVASEYSVGTIKFLIINPVKRWKILAAKYLSVLITGISILIIYYILNFLMATAFFGLGDIGAPLLKASDGVVTAGSPFLYVAFMYLLNSVSLLAMATFAFMISSLVRNAALAIGLGVFLMMTGQGVTFLLGSIFGMDWARYILFANTDINAILSQNTPFLGHTLGFALTVIAVYMIVFLLTAYDAFVRTDIK